LPDYRFPYILLHGRVHGQKSRGRPRKRWLDNVRKDCERAGLRLTQAAREAHDKSQVEIYMEAVYACISIARTLSQVSHGEQLYECAKWMLTRKWSVWYRYGENFKGKMWWYSIDRIYSLNVVDINLYWGWTLLSIRSSWLQSWVFVLNCIRQ